jgi:hypothetical protein
MEQRPKGKLRYTVSRTANGTWVVVDRHISKVRLHNDVVGTFPKRMMARAKCLELNLAQQQVESAA